MTEKEIMLFKALCDCKSDSFDDSLLAYCTPEVLGQLFYNRMAGIACETLRRHGLLSEPDREFRNSLKCAFEQSRRMTDDFLKCVEYVSYVLSGTGAKAALLKGAVLCAVYPRGCRTSNDIDILVSPENIGVISDLLTANGFRQGNIRGGEFVAATRREIIESRMLRGETVPFIKKIGFPYMEYLELDINYSLDYKNGDGKVLSEMLAKSGERSFGELWIPTLEKNDFIIHLCCHLHKEATTYPWVKMHRDMSLYKYADIYTCCSGMSDSDARKLFERAYELGAEKQCAFAVLQTDELFGISSKELTALAARALEDDSVALHRVISPADGRVFEYSTHDITKRLFMKNRARDLKEV